MARPANADAAATRGRILGEAARLFAAHGPSAVSIRDIARSAEVSLAMVHHYFGSKDELYAATVDAMYDELSGLRDELAGVVAQTHDLAGVLRLGAVRGLRYGRQHADALRTVMRAVVDTGEIPAGRPRAMLEPFLSAVEALIGPLHPALPRAELRLRAQTVCFVIARYALASLEDLAAITGHPAPTTAARAAAVLSEVEAHVAHLAVTLVAPPEEPPCPAPSPPTSSPQSPSVRSRSRPGPSKGRPRRGTTRSRR